MALLLITHDLGIVRKMADRVCVMTQGEIVEAGRAEEIFARPQHPYTRRLLAAEPRGEPHRAVEGAPVHRRRPGPAGLVPHQGRGASRRTVGHIKAVDGVSLTVREGQTVGVVGESGSGKTTLGLALLRLLRSEGAIQFAGRDIQGLACARAAPAAPRDADRLPGSLRLALAAAVRGPDRRGRPARARDRRDREERRRLIEQALIEVGLDPETRDRYPHEFSGGQRQRIAIARAIVLARLVVLDEPTSALDMSVQAQIVDLLRELQRRHRLAYLFISHDLRVVRALSDEVIVMREGRVVERGPAAQIFAEPREPYTRALMAAAFDLEAVDADVVKS